MSIQDDAPTAVQLGEGWRRLQAHPMDWAVWLGLARAYADRALPWQLDYCWMQASRCMDAAYRATGSVTKPECCSSLDGCWEGGANQLTLSVPWSGLERALALLRQALAVDGADWLSALYLVRCLDMQAHAADGDDALQALRQEAHEAVKLALQCEPIRGETGHLLAQWRMQAGEPALALAAATAALQQVPQRHGTWLLKAQVLMQLGHETQARQAFAKAGESQNPAFLPLLADKLFLYNFGLEALAVREAVTQLTPHDEGAWLALAQMQSRLWQVDRARQSVQRVLEMSPNHPAAKSLLDDLDAAGYSREQFERARLQFMTQGLGPNAQGGTRLLMQSLYQSHLGATEVAELHRQVGEVMQAQACEQRAVDAPVPESLPGLGSGRRLRVGYVSGDLHRQHPVNIFMLPILQRHDLQRLEVFVYHTGTFVDEYTRAARAAVDHWRECVQLDDVALHRLIVQDRLDVLVDLAGHTASHRLGVFAMRAAPVQMSYLGYPHSTGLSCMDWLIADQVVAPPAHQTLFSEKLAYVSGCVFCWAPDEDYPIHTRAVPSSDCGVTFGSFNNLLKLDDATLATWARILLECPHSRLLLKSAVLADPAVVRKTYDRFASLGVSAERLEFRGPSELSLMMQEYLDVDIALDPFPYNGGTTSLQALWMGCPMVSLRGENFVSRMGASFLTHMDRKEWVAESIDQYVEIALRLAQLGPTTTSARMAQRKAMQQSPVCAIDQQVRDIEDIFAKAVH